MDNLVGIGFKKWTIADSTGLLNLNRCQTAGVLYFLHEIAFIDDGDDMGFFTAHENEMVQATAQAILDTLVGEGNASLQETEALYLSLIHICVSNYGKFYFAIDVKRARSRGIRPLPIRVQTANGFEVLHEERKEKEVTGGSDSKIEVFDFSDCTEKAQVTKLTQWERKLLDLSLRNMLINMRVTKSVVPVLSADIGRREDALFDGEAFQVMPRPADVGVNPAAESQIELLNKLGELSEFISFESKHKRLHSIYSEKDLSTSLTKMYRSAKASLEENGASTLYLALGMLRWFEQKKNAQARYCLLYTSRCV